jgi:UDP-hydrolysing UDP-N-acetyl-D-glucosamine 2-epimerase
MVAHPHHQQRLVALGESPENIFLVGSVALDRIVKHTAHTKAEIEKILGVNTANRPIALFTFHPITGEREITERIIENTFKILLEHGYFIFANTPNTDPGSQRIRSALTKWKDHLYTHLFESLPNDLFLSLLKNCSLVIGNSSLGIYEAATIPVAVINIGLRQKERATSPNVVFISSEPDELNEAIKTIRSEKFKAKVKSTKNCYGDGNSVQKAVTIITQQLSNKEHNFSKLDPLLLNHEKEYINATGKH